ncbi:hypothetical protein EFE29_01065 [Streptococcus thermophilus]|nr:hypothetical protein [Streptococcus thermophilus]
MNDWICYLDSIYIIVDINRRTYILGKRGQSLSFFYFAKKHNFFIKIVDKLSCMIYTILVR